MRRAKFDFLSGEFHTIENINIDYIDDQIKEFLKEMDSPMLNVAGYANMMMSIETEKMVLKNTFEILDHSVILLEVIDCD